MDNHGITGTVGERKTYNVFGWMDGSNDDWMNRYGG